MSLDVQLTDDGKNTLARLIREQKAQQPIDRARACFAFDKPQAIEKAKSEGKSGARLRFQCGTEHAVLLNGQHVRMAPKLHGKAAQKTAKRRRRQQRELSNP